MRPLLVAVLLVSCRRPETVVRPDPTPVVDAQPAPPEAPVTTTRLALHGRIVDAATGEVIFPLRAKLPRAEASDARAAYVLDDDGVLCAWALETGELWWEVKTSARLLASDARRVLLAEGADVVAVEKATGSARRVAGPGTIDELHAIGGVAVVRTGSSALAILDPATVTTRATYHATAPFEGRVDRWAAALVPIDHGVCFVQHVPPDRELRCLDLAGVERFHARVSLSKPGDPPGTRVGLVDASRHHVLIGTFSFGGTGTARRAAVVRLSDGKEVARVEDELVAILEAPSGSLAGMITASPEIRLYAPSGARRWSFAPKWPEPYAKAVLHGDGVVVARHHVIATGVEILALRESDGALLWTGETKLPPISHSKYHNWVELASRGDAVVLRGHESSVEHVHVYDGTTGTLRFHEP